MKSMGKKNHKGTGFFFIYLSIEFHSSVNVYGFSVQNLCKNRIYGKDYLTESLQSLHTSILLFLFQFMINDDDDDDDD